MAGMEVNCKVFYGRTGIYHDITRSTNSEFRRNCFCLEVKLAFKIKFLSGEQLFIRKDVLARPTTIDPAGVKVAWRNNDL